MQIKLNLLHQYLVQFSLYYYYYHLIHTEVFFLFFFPWCLFKHFINLKSFSSHSGGKGNTEQWIHKLDSEDQDVCSWQRAPAHPNKARLALSSISCYTKPRGECRGAGVRGHSQATRQTLNGHHVERRWHFRYYTSKVVYFLRLVKVLQEVPSLKYKFGKSFSLEVEYKIAQWIKGKAQTQVCFLLIINPKSQASCCQLCPLSSLKHPGRQGNHWL